MSYPKVKTERYDLLGGMNAKVSPYLEGPTEFRELINMNFFIPGALTKRPGVSLYTGATVSGRITGLFEFERLSGASYLIATANTNAYTATSLAFTVFKTGLQDAALFDFVTFVDRLFAANGTNFFKYDGANATNYSLPPGLTALFGATVVTGGSLSNGTYVVAYGYLNDAGYYGPGSNQITVSLSGGNNSIQYYGLTTPSGYGISAIALYRTSPGGVDLFGTTLFSSGATVALDASFALTDLSVNDNLWFTLAPRFMELFNNQLFLGGFSSLPSTAFWSQIGIPEGIDPTFNAEFRTNDGDRLTGFKSYNGQLIVSKGKSLHRVTGDNPDNFLFSEISDQYGFLSNRAIITYENTLLGLDTKGIVEYNGANVSIKSTKMEPVFQTMNLAAAKDNATAVHFRRYNEIWFGIPCNGSTLNNCTVVYDYLANAWTKYEGFLPSTLTIAKREFDQSTVFFGGYSGNIFAFGASIPNDAGAAITCVIRTPFSATGGQTSEQQFRRLYLDVSQIPGGSSQAISVNLFKDYDGASAVISRTMYQAPFQSRIDFGIPAKSLAEDIFHVSASLSITVFGYAVESRYQRST